MKHYCLGFLYFYLNECDPDVLLIKKNPDCKLEFLRNKLNGIGGSIEKGETPIQAMMREFKEESSIQEDVVEWHEKGKIFGNGYDVVIFRGRLKISDYKFHVNHSFPIVTEEGEIDLYKASSIINHETVDNIPILLPLINTHNSYKYFLDYRVECAGVGDSPEPLIYCEKE